MTQTPPPPSGAAAILADPRWARLLARDPAGEGGFLYSVSSTGVYCRPGCSARRPRPEHVRFHATAAEAEAAAQRRERMAMDRIKAAEAGALAEVRSAAADIAAAAARSVIAEKLDAKADAALIDKAVTDLPKALRAA